jgi:class 3 adenylate cyclase
LEAHSVERKLAAIFAADVEAYSRLMGLDEVGTLRTLTAYRVIVDRLIASHRGRIFNTAGDSLVVDFASAVDAVQCAVEVQEAIDKENADRPVGEQMRFRIGLHVGDIIVQGDNLFGDGVNIAARLEALAEPGGICVSGPWLQGAANPVTVSRSTAGFRINEREGRRPGRADQQRRKGLVRPDSVQEETGFEPSVPPSSIGRSDVPHRCPNGSGGEWQLATQQETSSAFRCTS